MTDTSSDTSSKGLLPQLTEVLAALTESQDLLTRKVVELRKKSDVRAHDVDRAVDADSRELSAIESAPVPTNEDPGPDPISGAASRVTVESSAAAADGSDQRVNQAQRDELALARSGHGAPPRSTTEPSEVESKWNGDTPNDAMASASRNSPDQRGNDRELADRDYNFFDELDARLADIDSGSEANPGRTESGEEVP